ncbi:MAG: Isoleucyl-tRNA synthetase [Sporanaerobacter sp.]|jgi:hypothetical protein|uniref:hypothetical protein n=1 Tax=Sporanaerobacter sp. TaxID=2010183 RepID=UPI003A0FF498
MNVVEFSLLKRLKDEDLIENTCNNIDELKCLLDTGDNEEYWEKAMVVNDMIIEIKKRNLKIREDELFEKIIKK